MLMALFEPRSLSSLFLLIGIAGAVVTVVCLMCRADRKSRSKRARCIIDLSRRNSRIDAKIKQCLLDACGDYNLVDLDLTDMDLAHGYDILFFEEDVT